MISRDSLHRLVDNLPESEIPRAERVLQALKETAETPLPGVNYSCAAATIRTVHPSFSPARRRGRWAVGNAQRFPRGVGGCRVEGGGGSLPCPGRPPAGVMGVRGKRGASLWKSRGRLMACPAPCRNGVWRFLRGSSTLKARG